MPNPTLGIIAPSRVTPPSCRAAGDNVAEEYWPADWKKVGPTQWNKFAKRRGRYPRGNVSPTFETISGTWNQPYSGAVLLPDGRVFLTPYEASAINARIYDCIHDVVTTLSGGITRMSGGILLPDGRVICSPSSLINYAFVYDPPTNVTLSSSSVGFPSSPQCSGGIVLPNGLVFFCPLTTTTGYLFNANTLQAVKSVNLGGSSNGYRGCCLLPDGRVYIVPRGQASAKIYDPVLDVVITPSGTFSTGLYDFYGCVLMKDGRVFIVGCGSFTSKIYDPANDKLYDATGTYGAYNVAFGCLLPDGRVFCSNADTGVNKVYDPFENVTITTPGYTPAGSNAYQSNAVVMPDGRVFLPPRVATSALKVFNFNYGPQITRDYLSTYDNKL